MGGTWDDRFILMGVRMGQDTEPCGKNKNNKKKTPPTVPEEHSSRGGVGVEMRRVGED